MAELEVIEPGPLTTTQDRGRIGLAHLGVARSGAADRASLALANRLVGNQPTAAGLEITVGPFSARAVGDVVVAVTGAVAGIEIAGSPCGANVALVARSGAIVRVAGATRGVRTYLAVRGGVAVAPVLSSRSFDTLGRIGPPPLRTGDRLPVGPPDGARSPWWEPVPVRPASPGPLVARVVAGPDDDVVAGGVESLTARRWAVATTSDRRGWRLDGPSLVSGVGDGLSTPMIPGAVQVPPDGSPIVLGPDAGTTGGYPVVAVVVDADLDAFGQLRPGDQVRFVRS